MSMDIATLGIRVDALEARQQLNELSNAGNRTSQSMTAVEKATKALTGVFAGIGLGMLGKSIFDVNREMQSLRTSLVTVTGSAEAAQQAFKQIQTFAASTPYAVKEVTEAFVKLSTMGLRAGEKDLTSYGNTASAMGKSLNQMVEAVSDAATGEFERLKEFGIKSSVEGNKVTMTFKGVATTIKNNADEIQSYLKRIGDTDFAGGMARQSKTIDGAMSNLGDSFSNLMDKMITTSGEEWIAGMISGTSDVINSVGNAGKAMLTLGQVTADTSTYMQATWQTISETASAAMDSILQSFPMLPAAASKSASFLADVFKSAFEIVRLLGAVLINAVVGSFSAMGTAIGMVAAGIAEVFAQNFNRIKDMASGLALGIEAAMAGDLSFKDMVTAYARETISFKQVAKDVNAGVSEAMGKDYAKDFGDKIKENAKALSELQAGADSAGGSLGKLNETTKTSTASAKDAAKAAKEAESAAKSLQKAYDSVAESMSKAMTKTKDGDNNTAAMQYETTNGTLKALTDTKKQYLIQLATELDYKEKMGKSAEASKTAMQTEIDKYNELTLSAHDYFIEKLKAAGVNEADIPAISAKHDASISTSEARSKNDELQKTLESYSKGLDDINKKTTDLNSVSSSVFDGALGGINTVTGAYANMQKAIMDNVAALEELGRKQAENDKFEPDASQGITDKYLQQVKLKVKNNEKYALQEKRLNNENLKDSLSGIRQVASATGAMFAQNTAARKAFNIIALAASISERLADIAGLSIKAAAAVLEQGKGDPYTAFARIAAMAAIVGSVLAAAGAGTFSFGGGSAGTPPPTSPDTGTVLGDSSEKSQSINNTYQLLKDIHASEYAELRGINAGVAALSTGITSVITRLFQAGGITDAKVNLKATLGGIAGMFKAGFGGMNLDPIMGWLLGGIFGGATKQEITGGGIATGSASLGSIRKGGNLSASQYTTVKKTVDGGWFGDDKVSYYNMYQAIDSATQKALNSVFKSMGDTMFGLAKSLGGNLTQKVNDYIIPAMTVELRGLSGKDAAEKLNGVLSAALDTMSMSVFGPLLAQYQQLGEGMLETSTRIVAEMAIVKDALGMSGLTLTQNIIAVSDAIVQAAGGLKEFQAAFESYFDKFYSDSEKTARTYGQMSGALSDVGLTVAATRAGYRAQIEALNMNNALDQQRYSLLISLSTAADTYYSSLEKISDAMKLMTESNFKTAVDYTRYLSLASLSGVKAATTLLGWDSNTFMPTGQAAVAQLPTLSTPAGTTGNVTEAITNMSNSNANVAAEIKLLRDQQAAQALAIAQNTQETAKLLKRWDGDGMPAVRTTV